MAKFISEIQTILSKIRGNANSLSISVSSKFISSSTNFLLGIYLIRILTPSQFGYFSIGMAICLFFNGIGNSLFTIQMIVNTPDKNPNKKTLYAASLVISLLIFNLLSAMLVFILYLVVSLYFKEVNDYSIYVFSILLVAITYPLKDYFIRYSYSSREEYISLIINIVFTLLLVKLLIINESISENKALIIYSISTFGAVIIGQYLTKLPFNKLSSTQMYLDLKEAWLGGKWYLLHSLFYNLKSESYTFIVAFIVGSVGVGIINATKLIIRPVISLLPALSQVILPRMSEIRDDNINKLFKTGYQVSFIMSLIAIIYAIFVFVFSSALIPLFLGDQYTGVNNLVYLWCFYCITLSLRIGFSIINNSQKLFKYQFYSSITGGSIGLILVIVLLKIYGLPGAIVGLIIGEFFAIVILWQTSIKK